MLRMKSDMERMVAVLHDVVEDTDVTLDALSAEGFPAEVVAAVAALTKLPGESRLDAARRAAGNAMARSVKLADNAENMDVSRITSPTDADLARLEEYEAVRALLLSADTA